MKRTWFCWCSVFSTARYWERLGAYNLSLALAACLLITAATLLATEVGFTVACAVLCTYIFIGTYSFLPVRNSRHGSGVTVTKIFNLRVIITDCYNY